MSIKKNYLITLFLFVIFIGTNFSFIINNSPNNEIIDPVINNFQLKLYEVNCVLLEWNISGDFNFIKIQREFIYDDYTIALLQNGYSNFTDNRANDGTYYKYYLEVLDEANNTVTTSEYKTVTIPLNTSRVGAPQFAWEEYKNRKYPYRISTYLNYSDSTHFIYNYTMHGINVIVAINNTISDEAARLDFAKYEFRCFNRHWYKYRYFPIKEYRIIVNPDFGGDEDELGVSYSSYEFGFRGEIISHGIGHAWFGGLLMIENNTGGETFDPITEDSDKWILEGFTHLQGALCIEKNEVLPFLQNSLSVYNDMISSGIDKPLVDLPVYAGTDKDYTYYCKGALFAIYLHLKMLDQKTITLLDFMQYLYTKYNLTKHPVESWQKISTADLLLELNEFTEVSFNQDFDDFVYGNEELPIESISYSDIELLIKTDEDLTMIIILNTFTETPTSNSKNDLLIITIPILFILRLYNKRKKN